MAVQIEKSTFNILSTIDISKHTKVTQKQTYLPWIYAWSEIKKRYDDASYEVLENENGLPFFESPQGFMVKTKVTIKGETLPMWLPVMNSANKTMLKEKSSYFVKEYANGRPTGKMIEKFVEPCSMFDINTAIVRCITKNISMFGLGINLYKKEAMPEVSIIDSNQISEITKLAGELKVDLAKFNNAFGVSKVSDLYESNFDVAMQWIQDQM